MVMDDLDRDSLWFNVNQLAGRVRHLEKMLDTKDSPWWKRLAFRLDGWPAWYRVGARSWRPWHPLLPERLIGRLD